MPKTNWSIPSRVLGEDSVAIGVGSWVEATLKSGQKFAGRMMPDSNKEILHLCAEDSDHYICQYYVSVTSVRRK